MAKTFRCEDLALIDAFRAYRAFGLSARVALMCARRDIELNDK